METYQIWSLAVSSVVGLAVIAQASFAGVLLYYMKKQRDIMSYQKDIAAKQLVLNELLGVWRISDDSLAPVQSAMEHMQPLKLERIRLEPCEDRQALLDHWIDELQRIIDKSIEDDPARQRMRDLEEQLRTMPPPWIP